MNHPFPHVSPPHSYSDCVTNIFILAINMVYMQVYEKYFYINIFLVILKKMFFHLGHIDSEEKIKFLLTVSLEKQKQRQNLFKGEQLQIKLLNLTQ